MYFYTTYSCHTESLLFSHSIWESIQTSVWEIVYAVALEIDRATGHMSDMKAMYISQLYKSILYYIYIYIIKAIKNVNIA